MISKHLLTPLSFALLALLITSCSDKAKPPLEGKRYSVLESEVLLRTDLEPGSIDISLPTPKVIESWEQADYSADHALPHADQSLKGTIAWKESIGSGKTSTRALISPPVTDGLHVYTIDSKGLVQCRFLETGALVWEKDPSNHTPENADLPPLPVTATEGPVGGSLTLEGKALYVTYANGLAEKVKTANGKVVWHTALPDLLRATPLVHKNTLYVISASNKIYALNKETGALQWTNEGRGESLSFIGGASPAANEKLVVAPYSSGEVCALYPPNGLEFWKDSTISFKSLDSKSMIGQFLAHPVIHKDSVIVVSHGDLAASIDIKTGQRLWQKPFGGTQTPMVTDDFVFMVTSANDLVCLTRASGKIIWVHALPMYGDQKKNKDRILWYGPVLTGGRLMVVSSRGDVTFISTQDGQLLETNSYAYKFLFAPVLIKNKALLLTQSGELLALE